jgi:hypothetical protein
VRKSPACVSQHMASRLVAIEVLGAPKRKPSLGLKFGFSSLFPLERFREMMHVDIRTSRQLWKLVEQTQILFPVKHRQRRW